MFAKTTLCALLAIASFTSTKGDDNCDKLGVLLYEEIGCKPLKDKPSDACASSYDCSHLQEKGDHCFFQGKKYKNRDAIPDALISKTCNGGCFCDVSSSASTHTKFTCAAFDCAEFLGGNPLSDINCIRTYKLDGCCSSGHICPPFNNVTTCKVEGKDYKEGERFSPTNQCSSCVCQKGFSGKYEAPVCKRTSCGVELRHSEDIKHNCAPVYQKKDAYCCPYLWLCPSESDTFCPVKSDGPPVKTCKFGQKEIKTGQILKRSLEQYGQKYELKCECQLPPLLTCVIESSKQL